jgi:hypothetical protein
MVNKLRLTVEGVNDMIKRLNYLESNIDFACELITDDITTKGLSLAESFDAIAPKNRK